MSDMWGCSDRHHDETHNAQYASKERGREARPPKRPIQGQEERNLTNLRRQDHEIFYNAGHLGIGESRDPSCEVGRIIHSYRTRD